MMNPDETTNENPASHGEEGKKTVNPPAKPKPQPHPHPHPHQKAATAGGVKKEMCARPALALSVREASIARQFDKFAALAASRRLV